MSDTPDQALVELWVPLLRSLTDRYPKWGLWKNSVAALSGHGDFDSTAPVEDWDGITATFREWMIERRYRPVAACRHIPGVLFLVSLDRDNGTILELDVNAKKYFRGWTMFEPEDLSHVMEIDELGYRRVRLGAEGLILLVQNGLRWGGRPNEQGLKEKDVARFLQADPEGMRLASQMFGRARPIAEKAAEAASRGCSARSAPR